VQTLIFPCSGAADTGELADRAAREFSRSGCAGISCLAGIGANISGFIASARGADRLLVVDGCQLHCALKTLHEKGIEENITHLTVTQLGFVKGKAPATAENVKKVVEEMGKALNASSGGKQC
jgi:uncharacterized metal-binding protein